jgi:hypothetical protein
MRKRIYSPTTDGPRDPAPTPANTTYWLSTNIELKKAPITLHMEGCPILRRSRWRKLRVLTGPLTSAQIAVLPDRGYETCGRCKPEADAAMRVWLDRAKWGHGPAR